MELGQSDWIIIIFFFAITLLIGVVVSKKSGKSASEFFLSGRNMPWWLLGVSMVATTFSADTPNLVTDIVRKNGVSGNWAWWAFLLTGMLTVFVYAKLWRRSGVMTDLEFYELRYSGKEATFLRGFRAIYLGVFFNVIIMATVCLAAIKLGSVMLGISPAQTILIASVVTVFYSMLGGLRGVIFTDLFQFIIAMVGSIWATIEILELPQIGSLHHLLSHEALAGKLSFFPDFSTNEWIPLLLIPLAVQWWSVWYPGAEPGGGGYIAQRMLSAKNEKHAVAATLFFNVAHYALRPWPWILIALASLIVFPDLASIQSAFPDIDAAIINDDLAYPAMLSFLPAGLLGLVLASLIAAFMSTISTHLNWGSSYVVNDFYVRFIKPEATDREQVMIGRVSTVVLMVLAAFLALAMKSALDAFHILLQIGAGTGLIFILRWFWVSVNAYSEITGMLVSFVVALVFHFSDFDISGSMELILGVSITTGAWLLVTFITPQTSKETLISFYALIRPQSRSFRSFIAKNNPELLNDTEERPTLSRDILLMVLGCFGVYFLLFSIGSFLYDQLNAGILLLALGLICCAMIFRIWKKA